MAIHVRAFEPINKTVITTKVEEGLFTTVAQTIYNKNKVEVLSKTVSDNKIDTDKIKIEVENARNGKANLKLKIDEIETNISKAQLEITNARNGKTNLKAEIDAIKADVRKLQTEISSDTIKTASAYLSRTQVWQNLQDDTDTDIELDSIGRNDENMINKSEYLNGIIIRKDGLYAIKGSLNFNAPSNGGARLLSIKRNETQSLATQTVEGNKAIVTFINVTTLAYLTAGDKIKLSARQNSGAALGVGNAIPTGAELFVTRISGI